MKFSALALSASSLVLTAFAAPAPAPAAGAPVAPFTVMCAAVSAGSSMSASDIQSTMNDHKADLDIEGTITNQKTVNCVTNDGRPQSSQVGIQFTYANAHNDQAAFPPLSKDSVICSSMAAWGALTCTPA
ncbi:hypothetical protein LX32DRAFT_637487 [Colletotrichum zoysiae]|uniref:Uncharacterized protein n=1 Tax=Colletotrichum zoysiae TaxID=1216348 RepID=A0AAD9HNG4_9PEZI|nr:hypothetical protein LX32DRAFT_637487 [Colletotrichum zoysiae]